MLLNDPYVDSEGITNGCHHCIIEALDYYFGMCPTNLIICTHMESVGEVIIVRVNEDERKASDVAIAQTSHLEEAEMENTVEGFPTENKKSHLEDSIVENISINVDESESEDFKDEKVVESEDEIAVITDNPEVITDNPESTSRGQTEKKKAVDGAEDIVPHVMVGQSHDGLDIIVVPQARGIPICCTFIGAHRNGPC
jgi:hypothetical protein